MHGDSSRECQPVPESLIRLAFCQEAFPRFRFVDNRDARSTDWSPVLLWLPFLINERGESISLNDGVPRVDKSDASVFLSRARAGFHRTEIETAFNAVGPIDRRPVTTHVRPIALPMYGVRLARRAFFPTKVLFSSFQVTIPRRRGLSMLIAVSS